MLTVALGQRTYRLLVFPLYTYLCSLHFLHEYTAVILFKSFKRKIISPRSRLVYLDFIFHYRKTEIQNSRRSTTLPSFAEAERSVKTKLKCHKDFNPVGKLTVTRLSRGQELLLSFLSPMCREDENSKPISPSSATKSSPPPP